MHISQKTYLSLLYENICTMTNSLISIKHPITYKHQFHIFYSYKLKKIKSINSFIKEILNTLETQILN